MDFSGRRKWPKWGLGRVCGVWGGLVFLAGGPKLKTADVKKFLPWRKLLLVGVLEPLKETDAGRTGWWGRRFGDVGGGVCGRDRPFADSTCARSPCAKNPHWLMGIREPKEGLVNCPSCLGGKIVLAPRRNHNKNSVKFGETFGL